MRNIPLHTDTAAQPTSRPSWPPQCPADLATLPFKAAIFDFDGTVADSLGVWRRVDEIFFAKRGLTYASDYAEKLSILGFEDGARYTIDTYGLTDTVQQICDEWNSLGRELYRTDVVLRPGAENYIRLLLRAGVRIGLATTNAPEVLEAMEHRVPLGDLFETRVHGCDVPHHSKDHPDLFLTCARKLGVEPEDCVVFEDLLTAIETAKGVGMATVAVLTGAPTQNEDSMRAAADFTLSDWSAFV